jgi:hypothetical protein
VSTFVSSMLDHRHVGDLQDSASNTELWHNEFDYMGMIMQDLSGEEEKDIAKLILAMIWGGGDGGWPEFMMNWIGENDDHKCVVVSMCRDRLLEAGTGIMDVMWTGQYGGNHFVMHSLVRRIFEETRKHNRGVWNKDVIQPMRGVCLGVMREKLKEFEMNPGSKLEAAQGLVRYAMKLVRLEKDAVVTDDFEFMLFLAKFCGKSYMRKEEEEVIERVPSEGSVEKDARADLTRLY